MAHYLVAQAARLDVRTVIFDDRIWTVGLALRRRLARLRPRHVGSRRRDRGDPRAPRPRPRRRLRVTRSGHAESTVRPDLDDRRGQRRARGPTVGVRTGVVGCRPERPLHAVDALHHRHRAQPRPRPRRGRPRAGLRPLDRRPGERGRRSRRGPDRLRDRPPRGAGRGDRGGQGAHHRPAGGRRRTFTSRRGGRDGGRAPAPGDGRSGL